MALLIKNKFIGQGRKLKTIGWRCLHTCIYTLQQMQKKLKSFEPSMLGEENFTTSLTSVQDLQVGVQTEMKEYCIV